jgi:hypothetical protein
VRTSKGPRVADKRKGGVIASIRGEGATRVVTREEGDTTIRDVRVDLRQMLRELGRPEEEVEELAGRRRGERRPR